MVPNLKQGRESARLVEASEYQSLPEDGRHSVESLYRSRFYWFLQAQARILPWKSFVVYYRNPAFLASLAHGFLHCTVLSFSGRMITFLIFTGFSSLEVGIARTIATVAELSATWISPRVMKRLGSVRTGSVSIAWEAFWLTFGVILFLSGSRFAVTGLITGVVLSRIGLWGFDLAIQFIIQEVCISFSLLSNNWLSQSFRGRRILIHAVIS